MAAPARAQFYDENPSGRPLYVAADGRLTLADGEPSWLAGGFGKSRFGADGDTRARARLVEGDLVWQPHLGWSFDATVAAVAQRGPDQPVDLSVAYVSYRHDPIGQVRLSARLGLLWPPISLEHGGPAWQVTETITPSAINSWVGEELKTTSAEATASLPLGAGHLSATAAVFGLNDTAGTLITFRGWALHDEKTTAFSRQPLPPLNAFMQSVQAPWTSPVVELDNRAGFYSRLGWASPRLTLAAFYYDNRGEPQAVDEYLQWGWHTRFGQLSARWQADAATTLTAQALTGTTQMGYPMPDKLWVDTAFRSAFLLATRRLGTNTSVSARGEAFATRGRGSVEGPESSEDGWAATLAAKHSLGHDLTALVEVLHVESSRGERARIGLDPEQQQTVGQVALRFAH